ncbi:MAG TPA: hypothetical protein VFR13_12220 [Jiangellaceae bacterium]|nr:hypothetical protein [Jiangellaceae bacterium]
MSGSQRERREAVLAEAELRHRQRARGRAGRRAAALRATAALRFAAATAPRRSTSR